MQACYILALFGRYPGSRVTISGELPYKQDEGARWKFWKEPLIGTKILFCGRGLRIFPVIFFSVQYPKKYRKSFRCEPFEAKHPKRKQNRFFNPFYMGVLPPSPSPQGHHSSINSIVSLNTCKLVF